MLDFTPTFDIASSEKFIGKFAKYRYFFVTILDHPCHKIFYDKYHKSDWVLTTREGSPYSISSQSASFHRIADRAGVNFNAQTLRRTGIIWRLQARCDYNLLRHIQGLNSESSLPTYLSIMTPIEPSE
jgi:hypothetical protein